MAIKPNQVKLRIISITEAVNHPSFRRISKDGSTHFSNEYKELEFPTDWLGKDLVFNKNKALGYQTFSYLVVGAKNDMDGILESELSLFHEISTLLEGSYLEAPLSIGDYELSYDKKDKEFSCGCQIIGLDLANEIFKFIGTNLGYEISDS